MLYDNDDRYVVSLFFVGKSDGALILASLHWSSVLRLFKAL